MAASGSWKKIRLSGKGGEYVVMTGETFDLIVSAMNTLAEMEVAPKSNCGRFVANEGQFVLDLSQLDKRVSALEKGTGISYINTIVNNNPTTTITLQQQITNNTYRLDHLSANSVCVGNVVVTTFTS